MRAKPFLLPASQVVYFGEVPGACKEAFNIVIRKTTLVLATPSVVRFGDTCKMQGSGQVINESTLVLSIPSIVHSSVSLENLEGAGMQLGLSKTTSQAVYIGQLPGGCKEAYSILRLLGKLHLCWSDRL